MLEVVIELLEQSYTLMPLIRKSTEFFFTPVDMK